MGILQELFREEAINVCKDKPCLWKFYVRPTSEALGISLGIEADRAERPGITFSFFRSSGTYKAIFLTTKSNGQPKVNLELCHSFCDNMRREPARVFVRNGRRLFRIPKIIFQDSKFCEFCSVCEKELSFWIEEVLNGR